MTSCTSIAALLLCFTARADHYAGATITWTCAGPSTYNLRLEVYRDCNGASWADNFINAVNTCTGVYSYLSMGMPVVTDVSQVCSTQLTTCNGGAFPGFQRYTYTATHTLTGCDTWDLFWSGCCRNAQATNLNNGAAQTVVVQARTTNPCAPSCQWIADPMPYVCRNVPTTYAWTAFNGQSYSMQRCIQQFPSVSVNYQPAGFAWASPLGSWSFNATAGVATFTHGQQAIIATAVRCSTGTNWTTRDQQFIVRTCTNNPPTITAPETIVLCPGQTTSLTGPIYTVSVTGTGVTWGPQAYTAPLEPGTYPLVITATDNACPIRGEAYALINVIVWCAPLDLTPYLTPPTVVVMPDGSELERPWWDRFTILGQIRKP